MSKPSERKPALTPYVQVRVEPSLWKENPGAFLEPGAHRSPVPQDTTGVADSDQYETGEHHFYPGYSTYREVSSVWSFKGLEAAQRQRKQDARTFAGVQRPYELDWQHPHFQPKGPYAEHKVMSRVLAAAFNLPQEGGPILHVRFARTGGDVGHMMFTYAFGRGSDATQSVELSEPVVRHDLDRRTALRVAQELLTHLEGRLKNTASAGKPKDAQQKNRLKQVRQCLALLEEELHGKAEQS